MRYALIKNGEVINLILWDGISDYPLKEGESLLPWSDAIDLPRKEPAPPSAEEAAEQTEVDAIRAALNALRNGTGTAGERLTRIERTLHWLIRKTLT